MKIRRKKGDLKSNRARSMECIKFIGVDPTTAGSYNSSSHAGSYPSSRVCIPERCFTKCMHCIEFNHPPQKNQFFRPVVVPRPFHGCFKASKKKKRSRKRSTAAKIPGYRILSTIEIEIDYIYIDGSEMSNRPNSKKIWEIFNSSPYRCDNISLEF